MSSMPKPPRSPSRPGGIENRTEFQFYQFNSSVIDFTEKKLERLLQTTRSSVRKDQLTSLLSAYRKGTVVVAWCLGEPVYLKVTKEDTGRPACTDELI